MNLEAWHLVKGKFANEAFSGEGARLYGGRWNSPGHPLVYAAEQASLAVLELLVHLGSSVVLSAYVLIRCEFESEMVEPVQADRLPRAWRSSPALLELRELGDQWIHAQRSVVLEVPSAVLPLERNYLFNPAHADFKRVRVEETQAFASEPRLLALGGRDTPLGGQAKV